MTLAGATLKALCVRLGLFTQMWAQGDVLKATAHTRLRASDQYTSSTLIGGKGGAGPSLLHTMLEEPTEYMNARWM